MKNSKIFNKIIEIAEKEHLNLYHDITKEEMLSFAASLGNFDEMTDPEFDLAMLKIFARFHDAHTNYYVKYEPINTRLMVLYSKIYAFCNNVWVEVTSIGGLGTSELLRRIEPLCSYETDGWLQSLLNRNIKNFYVYEMLGLVKNEQIEIALADGRSVTASRIEESANSKRMTPKPYEYYILSDNILCVRYRSCREDESLPFAKFVEILKSEIENRNMTKYILDLRGNSGGNSEVLNPFQDLVREKKLQGVLLIDEGVFSSGRFAVARFKREFDCKIVGEPTGGAAKSYGYNKNIEVEGKRFSVSTRLWDFSDVFGSEGEIVPDVFVPKTIADINGGKDMQLDAAINEIKLLKEKSQSVL